MGTAGGHRPGDAPKTLPTHSGRARRAAKSQLSRNTAGVSGLPPTPGPRGVKKLPSIPSPGAAGRGRPASAQDLNAARRGAARRGLPIGRFERHQRRLARCILGAVVAAPRGGARRACALPPRADRLACCGRSFGSARRGSAGVLDFLRVCTVCAPGLGSRAAACGRDLVLIPALCL